MSRQYKKEIESALFDAQPHVRAEVLSIVNEMLKERHAMQSLTSSYKVKLEKYKKSGETRTLKGELEKVMSRLTIVGNECFMYYNLESKRFSILKADKKREGMELLGYYLAPYDREAIKAQVVQAFSGLCE